MRQMTESEMLDKDRRTGRATLEHRHFATIAAIIRDAEISWGERLMIMGIFAQELGATNPKFDRNRFKRACVGAVEA